MKGSKRAFGGKKTSEKLSSESIDKPMIMKAAISKTVN
jgi:hypothetical protein